MFDLLNLILSIIILVRLFKFNNFIYVDQSFKGQIYDRKKTDRQKIQR